MAEAQWDRKSLEDAARSLKSLSDDLIPRFKKLFRERIDLGEAAERLTSFNSLLDVALERVARGEIIVISKEAEQSMSPKNSPKC